MLRALHLIQQNVDYQTTKAAEQLARELGQGFEVQARVVPNDLAALVPQTYRLRNEIRGQMHGLIHALGAKALAAACYWGGKIVYTPAAFPSRRHIRWVLAASNYRDLHIVCPTDTMRRAFVEAAIPIERCHLIRPGVEFAKIKRRRDDRLRGALGFGRDDCVVLAAGESTSAADHHLAVWALAILHVLSPIHKLLIWGRGERVAAVAKFAEQHRLPNLLSIAEQRLGRAVAFEDLLPAADLVLVTATGPVATLPISICMAAALPIVATVTPTIAELLEDRHTALFTTKPLPRLIAQRILDLRHDTGMQWTISDMARTEAYEYSSLTRMLEQYRALYDQVATGKQIRIPQQQPGAGLRFHGRA